LNVTHPKLPSVLTSVLKEVIDIFDNPPYLHLGGDEVNMAEPCFYEIGQPFPNYTVFEEMLSGVLKDINYPESQVLRWEMTGQEQPYRAGSMTQYWMNEPGSGEGPPVSGPFFGSWGLYFDTNQEEAAWDVYKYTRRYYNLSNGDFPDGIVAGTFELDSQFWHERSVVGKLLAVSMGATNWSVSNESDFHEKYDQVCESVGFDSGLCEKRGIPLVRYDTYRSLRWISIWQGWKGAICKRLTKAITVRIAKNPYFDRSKDDAISVANRYFWNAFGQKESIGGFKRERRQIMSNDIVPPSGNDTSSVPGNDTLSVPGIDTLSVLRHRLVNQAGIIMDMVKSIPPVSRVEQILGICNELGMTLVQMRLADDYGFAVRNLGSQYMFAHPTDSPKGGLLPAILYQYNIADAASLNVSFRVGVYCFSGFYTCKIKTKSVFLLLFATHF
jgi:hypothetical protein